MGSWIACASRRPFARAFAPIARTVALAAAVLVTVTGTPTWAQAPAAPKAQPKAAPKAAPQPAPGPAQPAAPAATEVPPLTYSPWTKICPPKAADPNAHQVCLTGKEGRLPDNGFMVVNAIVMEQEGAPAKILRITVNTPFGLLVQPGTEVTVIVDQGQPLSAPFTMCSVNGCFADYEASPELIEKFKKGQNLIVRAVTGALSPFSVPVPLPDFAKAYSGPATDIKVVEERQKKLQEDILKRQQQLQQQQAAPPAPK